MNEFAASLHLPLEEKKYQDLPLVIPGGVRTPAQAELDIDSREKWLRAIEHWGEKNFL